MAQEKVKIEKITERRKVARLGSHKVAIDELTFRGGTTRSFQLCWSVGKKRIRRAFPTPERALEEAQTVLASLASARGDATEIDTGTLAYMMECSKKLGSVPLHVAVNYYLRHNAQGEKRTLAAVIKEYNDRKFKNENLSPRHTTSLKYRGGIWEKHFGMRPVSTLAPEDLEDFYEGLDMAPKSKHNLHGYISAILSFCRKRGYLPREEDTVAEKIDAPVVRASTPPIFSPDELRHILSIADKRDIPYIAICAFAGGRRAEVQRLSFSDICYDDWIIRLDTEKTKTNQRRVLEIPDNLKLWLEPYRNEKGPIVTTYDPLWRLREKFTESGAWEWKSNGLRHSFVSYHLALHRNAPWTSELAGNSVRMVRTNYKSLVSKAAAEAWFSIIPT